MTKQEVINLALMHLGNKKLVDIDDAYITNIYNVGRGKLLRTDYWYFATRGIQLPLVDDSSNDTVLKPYKYELPADMANIIKVYHGSIIDNDYVLMGKHLYSSMNPLHIMYTSTDIDMIVAEHFGEALSYWLAKALAPVMGNQNAVPMLEQLYKDSLKEAQGINGRDMPSTTIQSDYYKNARY